MRLLKLSIKSFVRRHIVAEGYQDSQGFYYGRK